MVIQKEIFMFNVTVEDMYKAYEDCRKRKKNTAGAKKFELNAMYNIIELVNEINDGKYKLKPSSCFVITYPTPREVFCASFRDRIVQHFVYNEINPIIEKLLIKDTSSCRKNKGTDYAIKRVQKFVRKETNNYKGEAYYLKIDLSGFFMSIDREMLSCQVLSTVWTKYTGKYQRELVYLIGKIIKTDITKDAIRICPKDRWNILPARKTLFGNSYGLAIGNITSQIFANFYLNDIDHFIKKRHKSYCRYVDDAIIIDRDLNKLLETKEKLEHLLPIFHQKMNYKKTIIRKVKCGIVFLGILIKPYYSCMSKSRINRLYFTSSKIHTAEDMVQSANSRKGMFTRYKGYRVAKRWYENLPKEITDKMIMLADYKFVIPKEKTKHILSFIGVKNYEIKLQNHCKWA